MPIGKNIGKDPATEPGGGIDSPGTGSGTTGGGGGKVLDFISGIAQSFLGSFGAGLGQSVGGGGQGQYPVSYQEPAKNNTWIWVVVAVVVIGGGITLAVVLSRKKK